MKKFFVSFLALFVLFLPQTVFAEPISSSNYRLGSYDVSVAERNASVLVQVKSNNLYGVRLAYSNKKSDYVDGKNILYITVGFQVQPISLNEPGAVSHVPVIAEQAVPGTVTQGTLLPSDTYTNSVSKDVSKILLTIKTNDFNDAYQQVVWIKDASL